MPNPTIRNGLLVLLTMTSGCVDAISFLALGQVFTAAMTGNTVLFGLAVSHAGKLSPLGYLVALLGFIVGAATGAVILRNCRKTTGWGPLVTWAIVVELAALVLFEVVVVTSHVEASLTQGISLLLIALLAYAMGVQGVTARRIGVNGVTTTVITSTLTGLVESVVWQYGLSKPSNGEEKKANTSIGSIAMWLSVIVVYGIGAALCGLAVLRWHLQAVWLPIGIVFIVIATATSCSWFEQRTCGRNVGVGDTP